MAGIENSRPPLHILVVVRQHFVQDALAQILYHSSYPVSLSFASSGDQIIPALHSGVDAILADPLILIQIENENWQKEIQYCRSATPLIALLPADTRDYRDAALLLGSNGLVVLEKAAVDLLPLLESLLARTLLVSGVEAKIANTAQQSAPIGESGHVAASAANQLERRSDKAVEQLAQTTNPAASGILPPAQAGVDGQSVFLRGLMLSATAVDAGEAERTYRTACNLNCGAHFCGLKVTARGDKMVKIEPAEFPDERYNRVCLKGISYVQLNAHPERLLYPLKRSGPRGSGKWERLTWDQALDEIAAQVTSMMKETGPESFMFFPYSGQLSALNGMTGVYLRLASVLGASGASMQEYGLDSAIPSGIEETLGQGSGYLANDYADLPNSRLILIWGANPVQSRMNWWRFFQEARKAGAKLVTIDPRFSLTASKSDEWIQIRPGTDLYLALGLLRWLISENAIQEEKVLKYTIAPVLIRDDDGRIFRSSELGQQHAPLVWDEAVNRAVAVGAARRPCLRGQFEVHGVACQTALEKLIEMLDPYVPEVVCEKTGVSLEQFIRLAQDYASLSPARIFTLYGIDRWSHGPIFGRLIATLAAFTGNIGIPGGGAGIDGMNDSVVFATSFTNPGGREYRAINPAELPGYILSGKPYPVRGVLAAFNNWLNQWPDRNQVINKILPALDLLVVVDQFMTDTAQWADYILPAATLFEREDMVKGPGPYIQYQPAIFPPRGDSRSDFSIAAALAERLGAASSFEKKPRAYLEEILRETAPHLTKEQVDGLFRDGLVEARPAGNHGIAFQDLDFKTPTGRIEFYKENLLPYGEALPVFKAPVEADLASEQAKKYPLVCLTEHNYYRVHSTFGQISWLRELDGEPAATLHPREARRRGILEGDRVRVFNERGYVVLRARVSHLTPPGMVSFSQGWQANDFIAGHSQNLTHWKSSSHHPFGANISFSDVLVEVVKEGQVRG